MFRTIFSGMYIHGIVEVLKHGSLYIIVPKKVLLGIEPPSHGIESCDRGAAGMLQVQFWAMDM